MQVQEPTRPTGNPCHVCAARGGCLARQVLDDPGKQQQLQQARRIQRRGEHVFREGEDADAFFIVRSGSVKSYLVTEDGEEQVLGFYLPGDVFGLDCNDEDRRMSSAMVLETASLCRFPLAWLAQKTSTVPLLKIAAEQMLRDHGLVLMLARKDADGRIASFLEDLGLRYRGCGYSASSFVLSMSRQDIACYLGLAVETVSRTLTRFQEAGVLEVDRREVEILDPDALSRLSGPRIGALPGNCEVAASA